MATAVFSEPMNASTITGATFLLVDPSSNPVPGNVTYDAPSATGRFAPTTGLAPSTTYTATLKGGSSGVKDTFGNSLASDFSWSFTTGPAPANSGPGGPILVIANSANPFSRYYGEILSAEGLNEYLVADISNVTASTLAGEDIVILGDMSLTSAQVSMLTTWVNGGGRLIAMHPDKQLAGLLRLTPSTSTLSNAYLLAQTSTGPGVGIVGESIQFHGPADLYTLSGASSLATLYSSASTPTTSPAVTLANAGAGQAAAFTYDLARSVVYTRQGNPAWSGQARDGQAGPIRSDDLYFGAASFDQEPDWVDLNKVAIPQADEQQRLLANLILQMNLIKKPMPRFWYLPSGFKAAVVLTGDDHGSFYGGGATINRFNDFLAASPTGCSVADWQCVRSTSYLFPQMLATNQLTDSQAAAYVAQGFEISVHVDSDPTCSNWSPAELDADYTDLLSSFVAQYPSVPVPRTHRMHCIGWSDYDTQPQTELRHGIRLDTSYYYWPPSWVNDVPGLFTGSGMPMRFADRNGNIIDVYQATTQMTDESGQSYPFNIDSVLDNAVGATGYYGAFVVQAHNDQNSYPGIASDVVTSARAHGVPIVSSQQMLTWLDGRNSSSFGSLSWSGNSLSFTIVVGTGARNLQAMVPSNSPAGDLSSITLSGSPVSFTTQTIKGVQYAFFTAAAGPYVARYGAGSFTVSGTISGTGGNAATVTLASGTTTVATTAASTAGAYSFSSVANGGYTVTPTKTGFSFTPTSQVVTVNGANVTVAAFSSVAQTFTVLGTISGTGGNTATVTLNSGTTTVATTTASTAGAYSFSNVANGSYTVTPTKTGFSFTPTSRAVTVNGANVTVPAFSSAAQTFTVSGTISGAGGNTATVTLTSGTTTIGNVTSSTAGAYTFSSIANGSYTVSPSKTGFTFTPTSQAVTVNGDNITDVNFTSTAVTNTGLATDAIAFKDNTSKARTIVTAAFSTTSANELLLAFVSTDAPFIGTNTTVSSMTGAGLTWTLVRRTNVQRGTAEIWRAFAAGTLTNVTVTATLSSSQVASMTVVTFKGADTTGTNGAGAIGATGTMSAATGAPTASLVTTRNNSWVFGVGNDWDGAAARTPGTNQGLVHQLLLTRLDTFWVQKQNATTPLSGTTVTINDTAPTNHRYNLTLVEVLPHL